MRIHLFALAIVAFPLAASGQTLKLPPRVVVQQATSPSVEDAATIAMMAAAKSAQEDLGSLMEAMKAANARKKLMRAELPRLSGAMGGLSPSSHAPVAVANPCAAKDTASWRTCLDRVQAKLAAVSMESGEKTNIDQDVDALKKDLDSMSEMGEMDSLRLQMAMDRMSKMMSVLSNVTSKVSETSSTIIQNIK